MSEYKKESQLLILLNFIKQNPGATLSISYMLLTLCGIFYSMSFYQEFDIAVLKLANMSDVLITGISEPAAILMFCGGLLIAYITDLISQYSYDIQAKWRQRPASIKRTLMLFGAYTPKNNNSVMLFFLLMFLLYSWLFVSQYAEWKSNRIKQGDGQQMTLTVDAKKHQVILLGTTTNFVFTFDPESKQANIYNVESVQSMAPIIEEEQGGDS